MLSKAWTRQGQPYVAEQPSGGARARGRLTLSLVSICARFLWTILTMPGGCTQASPSTCTGTPSSPRMVIFTWRHCGATEQSSRYANSDRSKSKSKRPF